MTEKLIVKDQIEINTSKEKVWDVLTNPEYIKQWDEIPENYSGGPLKLGSVIEWEGYSKLIVTTFETNQLIKLNMYLPKVDLDPAKYDVSYKYSLTEENEHTILNIEIGDFSPLPKAKDYYDTSLEWVQTAKLKIKKLSEKIG
jgi:uncharacterized protein YndB with AHSA1/START domain